MTAAKKVKVADCSCENLIRIAKRCGFIVYEGKKHCKIKKQDGKFITMIPRHNRLKRETVKGIIETLNAEGADISYS